MTDQEVRDLGYEPLPDRWALLPTGNRTSEPPARERRIYQPNKKRRKGGLLHG